MMDMRIWIYVWHRIAGATEVHRAHLTSGGQQIEIERGTRAQTPKNSPVNWPSTTSPVTSLTTRLSNQPLSSQKRHPLLCTPSTIQNGHAKYNWRLNSLDPTSIVERLQAEPIPFTDELPFANDVTPWQTQIEVGITDTPVIQGGVNRHIGYTAKRKDKNG